MEAGCVLGRTSIILDTAYSDLRVLEIISSLGVLVVLTLLATYVSVNSLYVSAVISGPSLPLVGINGVIGAGDEYGLEQSFVDGEIIEKIAYNYMDIYWRSSISVAILFAVSAIILYYPYLSRLVSQLVPLTYRLSISIERLYIVSFLLSLPLLLLLLFAADFPHLIICLKYIGGYGKYFSVLILSLLLVQVGVVFSIYSVYFIVDRVDVTLMLNILYSYMHFQYFEPGIHSIYSSIIYILVVFVFTIIAVKRRWIVL